MTKNLVIVESPAKAKTIEKYLGKDYTVKSSFGHIRDLPKKGLSIDKANNFEPTYEVSPEKKKVVAELKKLAKGAEVWLATDEDREGEAIAWHLAMALGLDTKKTKRIVFHEITKPAILAAIENPRLVDLHLVDAQQARRVLDRLVGYELSPVLWKKVRAGLSAGRVQSVAVRLIVERERAIAAHQAESSYKIIGDFLSNKESFSAELNTKPATIEESKKFLEANIGATYTVKSVTKKPGSRNPGAPFTTSTLQQEAARRLGFTVRQTMSVAQRLYESGKITYMRTDSTILSGLAINAAEQYIKKEFGDKYHTLRQFKTKDSSAQEAHEAIRPTDFTTETAGEDSQQEKLYKLIWQRALSSQMSPAVTDKTDVNITISTRPEVFVAKGEILVFDGFLRVYGGGKDDSLLPDLKEGQALQNERITATETFSRAPARYSEASLVKALEEMGIGRPSTYAPTISTVQDRGYVEKQDLEGNERDVRSAVLVNGTVKEDTVKERYGADRGKLMPTAVAEVTTDFLTKYFGPIVDYDFTVKAEKEFDDIADGKTAWNKMIAEFYNSDFKPLIKASADVTREETSQSRTLGTDPKSKKPIIVRFGRYGPMLQKGETSDEEKPAFAPLPKETTMDNVTLEQALPMFDLPKTIGALEDGRPILGNIGRFGPYIQVDKVYVSLKEHDPLTITEEEARELFAEKLVQIAERNVADFGKIKILKGPYGPYVTDGKKNARIAKDVDPTQLTEADAKKILDEAPAKKKFVKRRAVKK
ncbi:MAG: topoisomerase [Candidatus Saccharibacteria bacterium]|nr:topoisomerase [Candidatus Saccharibacteria bacterium]